MASNTHKKVEEKIKKVVSSILSLMLCVTLLPSVSFADDTNEQSQDSLVLSKIFVTADADVCVRMVDEVDVAVSDEVDVQANTRTQVAELCVGTYFLQYKDNTDTWVTYDEENPVAVANDGTDVEIDVHIQDGEDTEIEVAEEEVADASEDVMVASDTEPATADAEETAVAEPSTEDAADANIDETAPVAPATSNEEVDPTLTKYDSETEGYVTQTDPTAATVTVTLGTIEGVVVKLDITPVKNVDTSYAPEGMMSALSEDFYSDNDIYSQINYDGYNNYMVCINGDQPAWCSTPRWPDAPAGRDNAVTFEDWGWAGHAWDYLCCTGYPNTSFCGYDLTVQQALSATAAAAWLLGESGAFVPTSSDSTVIAAAYALYNDSLTYASYFDDDEAGWDSMYGKAHFYGCEGYQKLVSLVVAHTGSLKLTKTSTNPSLTANNGCFSFEGASFGLYNKYADFMADEGKTTSEGHHADKLLVADKDGNIPEVTDLEAGEWYMRELDAPRGYKRIKDGWPVDIVSGQTTTYTVADEPVNDPDSVLLHKVNAKGEEVKLAGDATLEGAQYAFDYYDGYYNTVEEAQASGSPMRHWVLKTNSNGFASLQYITKDDHSLLVEEKSDELFYDGAGFAAVPLGTLVIYELEAPTGYLKSNNSFIARYVQDDNEPLGGRWEGDLTPDDYNQGNESVVATETQAFYHLEVFKEIQGVENEVTPEGIQFDVVYVGTNAQEYGKTYATLTIDETGHASTKDVFAEDEGLPVGTYEVHEVESTLPKDEQGNYLIQPYSLTSTDEGTNVVATVTFPGNYEPMDVARVDCADYTTTPPAIEKKDIDTGEPISDVEFTLYKYTGKLGMNDGAIATDPATLSAKGEYWEEVEVVKTNEHGLATFSNQPYGIYMMVETEANYKYLNASETAKELSSADPLDTARIFKVDKNTPVTLQTWEDELIQIETTVDKSTIDVTSVGLVSKSKSDGGDDLTNVGKETYSYDVAFSSGNTNTYADEFWMIDELNMTSSPYDLRVTKIYMPTVINDTASTVHLLIRTNKSTDDAWDATSVVVKEKESYHPFSLTDGTSRFDGAGWRYVGEFSSIESSCIDVSALGLDTDEYLTGICLYYGAVEQGFITVDPLSYDVTSTHELSVGTVIPNTATSHITRNWANREGSDGGLTDDDEDSVTTTVITTFEMSYLYELLNGSTGHIGSLLAQTGDNAFAFVLILMALIALSGAGVVVVRRKQKKGDGVNVR